MRSRNGLLVHKVIAAARELTKWHGLTLHHPATSEERMQIEIAMEQLREALKDLDSQGAADSGR